MLAALVDYVLVSHFSHILALAYTLWALGVLPGSKDTRAHDAPKVLLLVIATLAALVFVDGGISESLYYDSDVPERWLFHLKVCRMSAKPYRSNAHPGISCRCNGLLPPPLQ
jgi:hypothetical protein